MTPKEFRVKGCKDFGYIIDALHLLKKPHRPAWHKLLDVALASFVFFGWYGGLLYVIYRLFHG